MPSSRYITPSHHQNPAQAILSASRAMPFDGQRNGMSLVTWNAHDKPEPITESTPLDDLIAKELQADGIADQEDVLAMNQIPVDALQTLLRFIVGTDQSSKAKWRKATLRLAVLSHAINLDSVGELPLCKIAGHIGCTKSNLSLYSVRLCDELQQGQVRGGKSRKAREVYRELATAHHAAAGHKLRGNNTAQMKRFSE